jgi:hypothetical protein
MALRTRLSVDSLKDLDRLLEGYIEKIETAMTQESGLVLELASSTPERCSPGFAEQMKDWEHRRSSQSGDTPAGWRSGWNFYSGQCFSGHDICSCSRTGRDSTNSRVRLGNFV